MRRPGEYDLSGEQPVAASAVMPHKPAGDRVVRISDIVRRRQMMSLLKERITWLKERDPKNESEKMQGAKYAYKMCLQWLRKNP